MQAQAAQTPQISPYEQEIAKKQAEVDAAVLAEQGADEAELQQFKQQKEEEYAQKIADTKTQGEEQKGAAQTVYSFSGFGRSTKAADTAVEIEKATGSAINQLNMAKEKEIAMENARLQGTNPKALEMMQNEISQLRQGAMDRQVKSLEQTAKANAEGGASYDEAINNLVQASSQA